MRFPDPKIRLTNLSDVRTKLVGGRRIAAVRMAVGAATVNSQTASRSAGKPLPVSPVPGSAPLSGSILPAKRIVASHGEPFSMRMGALDEYPKDERLHRLNRDVAAWNAAEPGTPVQPALHLRTTATQGHGGQDGKSRIRHSDALMEKVDG